MTDYLTLPTSQLVENPQNRRRISREHFDLLKDKLEKKRQYKPLIVTPTNTEVEPQEYMVIAGNHRLKAYKALGVEDVWVSVVEFVQDPNTGLWSVVRDQVEEMERYQTKDDAMLDWALTDNEEFAENDWDAFVNDMHGYNLDWTRYIMSDRPPKTVSKALTDFLMKDEKKQEPTEGMHQCPDCGDLHARIIPKEADGAES